MPGAGKVGASKPGKHAPPNHVSPERHHVPEEEWTISTAPGEFIQKARHVTVIEKINQGRHAEITLEELSECLFSLSGNIARTGEVTKYDLKNFLMKTFEPACTGEEVEAVWQVSTKTQWGNISLEELTTSVTQGAIGSLLDGLMKDAEARAKEVAHADVAVVHRPLLVERINWRANRDDAFLTLPYAVTYMLVFIALVVTHLRIWERRRVENSIYDWVVGYSKDWGGPYVKEHVNNIPNFWIWLDDTGLPSVFGHQTDKDGQPAIIIANRNYVISDVTITQVREDEEERADWLIHSPQAQAILPQGDYLTAARARSQYLQNITWADQATEELKLTFCTYNEEVHMFARTQIKVIFDPYGVVSPKVITTAVLMQPYKNFGAVIFSFLFVCCIIYPLVGEGKEILSSLRHGWRGFKEYWGFWNIVDWTAICVGIVSSIIWILCGASIAAEPIQSVILDDFALVPDFMSLDTAKMDGVLDALDVVIRRFFTLHLFLAFDVLAIVMKLFKAFQSNARLSVVTDTLAVAAVDIIHFMIVFMVIFASFALVGHILFGQDLQQFTSFGASLMTSFHILMGEFGWYAEFYVHSTGFGSGMPQEFLTIWFLSYMTFVLLVLLNMLLAVILDRYTQTSSKLEGNSAEAPPLWEQVGRFRKRRKETKGFIPFAEIGMNLDSPDVHPDEIVTAESLQSAFCEMKPDQAAYLMKWLSKEAAARAPKEDLDDVAAKLAGIESFVSTIAEEMHLVKMSVTASVKKLNTRISTCGSMVSSAESRNGSPRRGSESKLIVTPTNNTSNLSFSRFSEQLVLQQTAIQDLSQAVRHLRDVSSTLTQRVEAQEQSNLYLHQRLKDPQLSLSMQVSNFAKSPAPKVLPNCFSMDTSKFEYSPRTRRDDRDGLSNRQHPAGRPCNVDHWRH